MKKIYMILAAISLLSMSLNAQMLPEFQRLKVDKTQTTELRNGKHFNVSQSPNRSNAAEGKCNQPGSLQMKGKNGKMMAPKAPLKVLNDGEYYVGPYTTDEFSTNGLGFGDQYNQDQSILMGVILNRSEFEEHLGDEIVGFRFALAGTGTLPVFEFAMVPYHDDSSSLYFDQDNLKEWGMSEWNQPTTTTSTVTFNQANDYGTTSVTKDGVTISTTNGNLAQSYNQYRFYSGSTTTISVTSGTITNIQFTGVSSYPVSRWTASTGTLSTSGNNGTWTGNASSVSFTANGQVRCTQIVVTVTDTSTPTYQILDCGQWHEYRLSEPVVFNVASDVTKLFLGYSYYQELTSGSNFEHYPIAVNPNSTGHDHMALMYADASSTSTPNYQRSWWMWDFSEVGDLAVQLIFKSELEKTATPTITVTPGSNAYTVTATGNGTVTLTVGDQTVEGQGTVSITVPVTPDDQTVTATATAQEEGKRVSDPATETVTIPGAGRTPMPTINVVWNGDQCTITATGDGEVHMYIDGVEVTQPYVVEEGATAKTIVVTATAEDTAHGLAISNTASQTVEIPAMSTAGFSQLDGTYSSNDPVDFSKVLFCDRFSVSTATNTHPFQYDYVLKENTGQKRSTNTVEVPVQKTGSAIMPYYTLDDVDADLDRQHVTVDVLNANQEIYLSPSSKIFFYTLQRGADKNTAPTKYFSVMQRQPSGSYKEMQNPSTNYGTERDPETYYDVLDDRDLIIGTYGQDYMAYVPVVWTYGYDRVGYNPNDPVHNSYGAPIWKTGVGAVSNITGACQRQENKWTTWTAPDGKACSLFRAHLEADGLLPQDGLEAVNVDYVPYMFRIWVVCDSLRNWETTDNGFIADRGAYGSNIMWLADVPCEFIDDAHGYNQHLNYGNINEQTTGYTNQLVFGANNGAKPTFIIRFYYRASGHSNDVVSGLRGNRDGSGDGYGAAEGSFDPGDPGTGIEETRYLGEIVGVTYYNAQGMKSDKPFDGLNIVITRYSDGTTTTTKVLR